MKSVTDFALPTVQQVVAAATAAMFGKPLVTNVFRSMLVEAIVAEVLQPDWTWCAADYAAWDFEHFSGVRLEVKQSAARQSWTKGDGSGPISCRFDIAHRTGSYVDNAWVEGRRRFADIYVLAHHPVVSLEADHRDASQWQFYAIAENRLPQSRSIGLSMVRTLADPLSAVELCSEVQRLADTRKASSRL